MDIYSFCVLVRAPGCFYIMRENVYEKAKSLVFSDL